MILLVNFTLELASYYENASQYQKMKKILLESERVCRQNVDLDKQLAVSLLFLGHYYFYIFKFDTASDYMNQAKNILETIFTKEIEQERKDIFGLFNNCLHYLGRVYFAQHDFAKASQFYIEA